MSGTPQENGTHEFRVMAFNDVGQTEKTFTLTVNEVDTLPEPQEPTPQNEPGNNAGLLGQHGGGCETGAGIFGGMLAVAFLLRKRAR